jgi:DNA-binding MurR/RpiR family transcriptional regulator
VRVCRRAGESIRPHATSLRADGFDIAGVGEDGVLSTRGLIDRMRTLMPALNPADRRVAEHVVARPELTMLASVSDVAIASGTSTATVVRLCQKLGLRGFQHLKIAIAQDLAPRDEIRVSELTASSSPAEVLATVIRTGTEGLASIPATLDIDQFARAVALIAGARRVVVCGVGSSAAVARDFGYRLLSIGLEAEAPADGHHQHLRACLLGPGDALVAISNSGATRETIENASAAARAGATTIAITGYRRSPLADAVDVSLVAGSQQMLAMRTESMASRLIQLAVLDALVVGAALARGDGTAAALDAVDDVASRHRY